MSRTVYCIDLRHEGLKKYRRISGSDQYVVHERARLQLAAWNEAWSRIAARADAAKAIEEQKDLAAQRNQEAQEALEELEGVLAHSLGVDDRINWQTLKSTAVFEKPAPMRSRPVQPRSAPRPEAIEYQPTFSWLDGLFASRKRRKVEAANAVFQADHAAWQAHAREVAQKEREADVAHEQATSAWQLERDAFLSAQKVKNDAIDHQQASYESKDPESIVEYCDLVLSASSYPDWMPREFELDYRPSPRTLIIDYQFPTPEALPSLKSVRYIKSRDEIEETPLPEPALQKMYDKLLYEVSLRVVHELFEADTIDALGSVAFNGWVQSLDKATGKEATVCILSLHTTKAEFLEINLAQVDPKTCFKGLKGVGSSKLYGMTAIAPILQMDRADRRFIPGEAVIEALESGSNLASMDWEDFEHLIREVFEKEFSGSGGEVKVTRASRDGGVDAVAFDPDPIRGGKIVIQAKRYTNTVGVSAVRDLYGTLLNEGATKGVLVTTSDYGPDAYEFAKGKPITLLNGSNLLHLLEKHGHRARIDLREAKQQFMEE